MQKLSPRKPLRSQRPSDGEGGGGRGPISDTETGSYSGSSYTQDDDGDEGSIDGTSPAVIAQVSELLNYVYGKTSVPGQIDRVSTIMRAYEGREAVLLELLETKALIKANAESEAAGVAGGTGSDGGGAGGGVPSLEELPERLRNSPALQNRIVAGAGADGGGLQSQSRSQHSEEPVGVGIPIAQESPVSGLTTVNSLTNGGEAGATPLGGGGSRGGPGAIEDEVASEGAMEDHGDQFNGVEQEYTKPQVVSGVCAMGRDRLSVAFYLLPPWGHCQLACELFYALLGTTASHLSLSRLNPSSPLFCFCH